MAIIYRKKDRLKIQIDDIEVHLRPLTYHEKSEVSAEIMNGKISDATMKAIKYSLKDLKNVQTPDGESYELEFDGDYLTEDCVNDILNLGHSDKLTYVCYAILNTIPDEFVHPETGLPLEGVSIIKGKSPEKK